MLEREVMQRVLIIKELVEPLQGSVYMGNRVYIVVESLRDSFERPASLISRSFNEG